jgi:hypothetical protein
MPILGIMASSRPAFELVGSYDSLATVTVPSGGVASVSFVGIPTGYKHLQIRGFIKSNYAANQSAMGIQLNSTTSGYFHHGLYGDGASAASYAVTSSNTAGSSYIAAASSTNIFGAVIIDILDYADTNKNKTVRILSGADFNGSGQVRLSSGSVALTSAITSLSFLDLNGGTLFNQYSSFALYGCK